MDSLLRPLQGGDRRSIGAAAAVVDQIMADPGKFAVLVDGMSDPDPLIRMRCSDVSEKVTARRPELLFPYKRRLIELARVAEQQEVRWHLAQMIPRLSLTPSERSGVLAILTEYLKDESRIVKTMSMQALADLALQEPRLHRPVLKLLEELTRTGSPAMRSRGRKLLRELRSQAH